MRSSESQHLRYKQKNEADRIQGRERRSRRRLFLLQCAQSAAGREQPGNNRPGSCSHQQTVYCKKVVGSKAKHQPETESIQRKIQYLLRKPGTWKTEVRNSHSEFFLKGPERDKPEQLSSARLLSCVATAIYCCLQKGPGRAAPLPVSTNQCYSGFSVAPCLVCLSAASAAYARYLSKQDSLLFSVSKWKLGGRQLERPLCHGCHGS